MYILLILTRFRKKKKMLVSLFGGGERKLLMSCQVAGLERYIRCSGEVTGVKHEGALVLIKTHVNQTEHRATVTLL